MSKSNIINVEFSKDGQVRKTDSYNRGSYRFDKMNTEDKEQTSNQEELPMTKDNNFELLFKELKDDMREREARTREEIIEREQRFESTLNKYHEENKEREQRIFAAIERLENRVTEETKEMKEALTNYENKINESINHLQSMKNTTFWGQVAFIISVAAIIVSFIIMI